jgi:hypothetical protein
VILSLAKKTEIIKKSQHPTIAVAISNDGSLVARVEQIALPLERHIITAVVENLEAKKLCSRITMLRMCMILTLMRKELSLF